jgi:single-strand DNA-binding protein
MPFGFLFFMTGTVNKVILVGRLGSDPEIRVSQEGNKIARFSVATSESWNDKNTNEKKEKTEWHRIVVFSKGLAQVIENYVKKGSQVYLEGQLRTNKYTDQAGIEKFSTEVHLTNYNSEFKMLDSKNDNPSFNSPNDNPSLNSPNVENSTNNKSNDKMPEAFDIEDDVPF